MKPGCEGLENYQTNYIAKKWKVCSRETKYVAGNLLLKEITYGFNQPSQLRTETEMKLHQQKH